MNLIWGHLLESQKTKFPYIIKINFYVKGKLNNFTLILEKKNLLWSPLKREYMNLEHMLFFSKSRRTQTLNKSKFSKQKRLLEKAERIYIYVWNAKLLRHCNKEMYNTISRYFEAFFQKPTTWQSKL